MYREWGVKSKELAKSRTRIHGGNLSAVFTTSEAAIVLALAFAAWVGVFFAWCAESRLRAEGIWAQPPLALVGTFFAIVLAPVSGYLYLAYPDWMWHYLLDGDRIPPLAVVPFIAFLAGALLLGYWAATRLAAKAGVRALIPAVVGTGSLVLILMVVLRRRLAVYGEYVDFHGGTALGLMQVKLGVALVPLVLGVVGSCAYVGWELRRDGKKVRER
jgi:hypothetical protein